MRLRFVAVLALVALSFTPQPARSAPLDGRDPRDDIFYQIMPISWRDSDNDTYRYGDFGGMTASLPYLQSLGVTSVWMNSIFTSVAYHGYHHMPPNLVNPWFGTEAQFWSFVNAAHSDSIKVMLDFVAYCVSQNSNYFASSYNNPASPYSNWIAYTNSSNSAYDGGSYTTWNGNTVAYAKWNLANAPTTAAIDGWCQHWMDPNGDGNPADGIDGWRLDHVVTDEGWGYNTAWWQQWKDSLLVKNPSTFTFAEQGDWGSYGAEFMGPMDATFTYPFMFAARSAIASETAAGLYSSMRATIAALPAGHTYIAILNNHDNDRLTTATGTVVGRNKVAAAILLTQPYPPCLYYGDEIAMRGTKGNWGTDANDIPNREPMKWLATAGAPMSNYFVQNASAYNSRYERNNDGRSVVEQQGLPGSLLETYRSLITLRKQHVALRRGEYDEIANSSTAVWAFMRRAAAQESLIVAINLSASAVTANLDLSTWSVTGGSTAVTNILTSTSLAPLTTANQAAYPLAIPAYSWVVLTAQVAPGPPPPPSPYDGMSIPATLGSYSLIATQTCTPTLGDNVDELDQLYVRPQTDGLAVGITGNLDHTGNGLAILFDTVAGGQDSLNLSAFTELPSGPASLTGLGMDTGFTPDRMLWVNLYGSSEYLDFYTLATGGGGSHRYIGAGVTNSLSPALSGGANTNGMLAAFDDSNAVGVTANSAAGAGTATQGFEALIPWADLGLSGPGSPVGIMAAIVKSTGALTNQCLPPLPAGAGEAGLPPLSLKSFAGLQYATVSTTLGVPPALPPAHLSLTAAPNPFRDATTIRFAIARAAHVQVDVIDSAGRLVRALGARSLDAGTHAIAWDGRDAAGAAVHAGLYFVRLDASGLRGVTRVVRLPAGH